jgi:hypothetical protein
VISPGLSCRVQWRLEPAQIAWLILIVKANELDIGSDLLIDTNGLMTAKVASTDGNALGTVEQNSL